uniref:Uncharacterized protein n=1 Tax=Neolamprologus brichardi TaxID=32507 RepID=A0A3Q4G028_NEOBR
MQQVIKHMVFVKTILSVFHSILQLICLFAFLCRSSGQVAISSRTNGKVCPCHGRIQLRYV